MNYTSAQLGKMNKDSVITIVEELQSKLETLNSVPLTSAQVEKNILLLNQRTIDVAAAVKQNESDYKLTLKKLDQEHSIKTKELELAYNSQNGKTAESIANDFKALKESVEKAKSNLDFGLKQKEIEYKESIEKLDEEFAVATEKAKAIHDAVVAKLSEEADAIRAVIEKSNDEVTKVKLNNEREIEEMVYDHKIAIRDKNIVLAEKIAEKVNKTLIDNTELSTLKEYKALEEDKVATLIEESVKSAKSKVYAEEGNKYSTLKSETTLKIQLLEKDKSYLTDALKEANDKISSLEHSLSLVPGQIKDAVEAAKADVTINQDNKK